LKLEIRPIGPIRPMAVPVRLVNHMFPSGPATRPSGPRMPFPAKFEITPVGVTRPIVLSLEWVNHRLPSGPAVISDAAAVLAEKKVNTPDGEIRPIGWLLSTNQMFPSEPAAMLDAVVPPGRVNVETAPAVVIRPIEKPW